jgi:hypothetical protein
MATNNTKPVEKVYWDVKIEATLPATLTYRVLAETPEEAIQLTKNMNPSGVKYKLAGKKNLKATVYNAGTMMVKLVKNLMGWR